MNQKTIIFDFGGVLIDWNPRHVYRKIFNTEAETEWFLENICTTEWNLSIDKGKPFAAAVKELCAVYPEWSEEIEAFHHRWAEMLGGEIHESVEILREIQAAGYPVYGLTNWSAETFPIAFEQYKFFQTLDGIVVSGREKLIKPDPLIFEVMLDRYNLRPEGCIFIDDNLHNILAADKLGFATIHFTSPPQLKRHLQQLGIIVV
jgi:2-haloacid dehalogenase